MKRQRSLQPLLLSILLPAYLLLAGCSAMRGSDDVDDQIKELQQRVLELQRKAAVSDVELSRLRQQVAELTGRQGGGAGPSAVFGSASGFAAPSGVAERSSRLTGASHPSRAARGTTLSGSSSTAPVAGSAAPGDRRGGAIDETDIEVPAPVPTLGSNRRPAPVPAPRAASAAPLAAPPSPTAPRAPSAASPAGAGGSPVSADGKGEPVTPAVQALYDRGYTLYHQKHYVDAETSFQRFIQAEPNSELADNAQYWIGECRYSRGDMRGALAAFRETVARYPQGNKTPDALLKAGMSLEALGDREGARGTYQDVQRRFPGTAVAAVAEERRAKLP